MRLLSLASHFPQASFTQAECLDEMRRAPFWGDLRSRSRRILEKVFGADTGIVKRHFAEADLAAVWGRSAQELNAHYERTAPQIGQMALRKALDSQNLAASDIDVLLVSSCTGFLCPGVSSYVAERLGCKPSIHTQDVTGHGCGAAIPLAHMAQGYTCSMPGAIVATLSVEICSAAFYVSDDPDVLISTCLFGDGASASLWSSSGGDYQASGFQSLLLPHEREKVRFVNEGGKLKNQLHRSVPQLTAGAAGQLYHRSSKPQKLITHGGGRDVVLALEAELATASLPETRQTLADFGNLSSPSVMVALEKYLSAGGDEDLWLASFGAGFSAHTMELKRVQQAN